jgi:peptidoglycan LD-endopeptidase LytH
MMLNELLSKYKKQFSPLFLPELNPGNTFMLDFSVDNPEMKDLDFQNVEELNAYVFNKIKKAGMEYGYGGYMEDREVYRRSPLFAVSPEEARSIHLGIDVWTQAGKPVHAPMSSIVHSFANNDNYGDYGPTIILEHELEGIRFYTLYGHLDPESIENLVVGKSIEKGEPFCHVGNFPVNGDWPPHLHFQVILDMGSKKGDFPGVCSKSDKEKYMKICPDPIVFFSL